MMTMLVATLGLLPAATSHAIGSDSQRPFAIVIVGGLIVDLEHLPAADVLRLVGAPDRSSAAGGGIEERIRVRRLHKGLILVAGLAHGRLAGCGLEIQA